MDRRICQTKRPSIANLCFDQWIEVRNDEIVYRVWPLSFCRLHWCMWMIVGLLSSMWLDHRIIQVWVMEAGNIGAIQRWIFTSVKTPGNWASQKKIIFFQLYCLLSSRWCFSCQCSYVSSSREVDSFFQKLNGHIIPRLELYSGCLLVVADSAEILDSAKTTLFR